MTRHPNRDSMIPCLCQEEKAALTRARKKIDAGDHNLTTYEQEVYDYYSMLYLDSDPLDERHEDEE